MAVYTEITPDELSSFLKLYEIGELVSYHGVAEGVENSNFSLTTTKGNFFLTLYEKRVNKDDLPFFLGLMQHLSVRGINCPLPVIQNNGAMIGELCERPAAIITFLEGFSLKKCEKSHCYEVGQVLAKFHLESQDFKLKRENSLTLKDWRPLFMRSGQRAEEVQAGLYALIEKELNFLEKHWPHTLPQGILHADLFMDNVFFLNGKLSGIIDFYFACNDILVYDLVTCLNAWCFEASAFDFTKGQAMIAGYQSLRPLSQEEREALPILARGSALRFLLTRLYDWLNVPKGAVVRPKDPKEYLSKLIFHQSVLSSGEYGA